MGPLVIFFTRLHLATITYRRTVEAYTVVVGVIKNKMNGTLIHF